MNPLPNKSRRNLHVPIIMTVFLLAGIAIAASPTTQPTTTTAPADPAAVIKHANLDPWTPIFRGVEMCQASTKTPLPLQVRAVRIDLNEPTIRFMVTPSNGDEPLDTASRTVSDFLTEFKCQVAINGSFFDPFAKKKGDPQDVIGLSLSGGDLYSSPDRLDAILISKDRKAWIDIWPIEIKDAYNGLAGNIALLVKGEFAPALKDWRTDPGPRHPRSAVGISRDGRYLILMTIDGRQAGYSEGTTYAETATWLRRLGAYDGLNLDGGGSTTLVIEGPDGKPKVLNRPSGKAQRMVANQLGVFAKPLPKNKKTDNGD